MATDDGQLEMLIRTNRLERGMRQMTAHDGGRWLPLAIQQARLSSGTTLQLAASWWQTVEFTSATVTTWCDVFMMVPQWAKRSLLTLRLAWVATTTGAGGVVWGLELFPVLPGGSLPSVATVNYAVTAAAPGAINTLVVSEFPKILLPPTIESAIFRLLRYGNFSADTYASAARLVAAGLYG